MPCLSWCRVFSCLCRFFFKREGRLLGVNPVLAVVPLLPSKKRTCLLFSRKTGSCLPAQGKKQSEIEPSSGRANAKSSTAPAAHLQQQAHSDAAENQRHVRLLHLERACRVDTQGKWGGGSRGDSREREGKKKDAQGTAWRRPVKP